MLRLFDRIVLIVLVMCSQLAIAATPVQTGAGASVAPLKVVTSFSILADLVRQVGGTAVDVHSLVGPDSDAHVFSPTPHDAKQLAQADLVVINGLGFEGWMERLISASGFVGPVVVASDGVDAIEMADDHHDHHGGDHGHGSFDPHAWQDLGNVRMYVTNIRDALIELVPTRGHDIEQRAQEYIAALDALNVSLRDRFAAVAPNRRLLVSHDAFAYLAKAYGLKLVPIQGRSTAREISAADVASLIRDIRSGHVHAYFIENMADPRMMQRIAQEAELENGGRLYSDALSAPGTEADTYLKLYETNANRLLDALKDR